MTDLDNARTTASVLRGLAGRGVDVELAVSSAEAIDELVAEVERLRGQVSAATISSQIWLSSIWRPMRSSWRLEMSNLAWVFLWLSNSRRNGGLGDGTQTYPATDRLGPHQA
jgi:hypothetical protein